MTYRRVVSFGLIAGLRVEEINRMHPGEVLDMYAYRAEYDLQCQGKRMGD